MSITIKNQNTSISQNTLVFSTLIFILLIFIFLFVCYQNISFLQFFLFFLFTLSCNLYIIIIAIFLNFFS